jgi:hypothetical protein
MELHGRDSLGLCENCRHAEDFHFKYDLSGPMAEEREKLKEGGY